jgi:acetoin utilization protein AcuB
VAARILLLPGAVRPSNTRQQIRRDVDLVRYMTIGAHAITCDASVAAAARIFEEQGIRHLPVLQGGVVVGVLSQRDLVLYRRFAADSTLVLVDRIMSTPPLVVGPDASLCETARRMAHDKVGCVVVVEHGKLIGIFTTVDALRALVDLLS